MGAGRKYRGGRDSNSKSSSDVRPHPTIAGAHRSTIQNRSAATIQVASKPSAEVAQSYCGTQPPSACICSPFMSRILGEQILSGNDAFLSGSILRQTRTE